MRPPRISVIICTYNRADSLTRAVTAFREQEKTADAEIIVVDNNSCDRTSQAVRHCAHDLRHVLPVTYVDEPVLGLSRARNAGIAAARGDILAFLDDDARPAPGWLAAIDDVFAQHPETAAAGGPVVPEFQRPRPPWLGAGIEGYYSILDLGAEAIEFPRQQLPFGTNMALRRCALGDLRFSESLGRKGGSLASGEEFDVLTRLRARGGEIVYAPAMRVHHVIPAERLRTEWLFARARAGGVSLALAAARPAQRAELLLRVAADDLYWRARQILGIGCDPVLLACRRAQYRGIYSTLLPLSHAPRSPAETSDDR